jgi:hypothetical protein
MAAFGVVSDSLAVDAITQSLGVQPDAAGTGYRGNPSQASWELRADGDQEADVSTLVASVLSRIRPLKDRIAGLREQDPDLTTFLRVIEYIRENDTVGPGFALDPSDVALLADLGAFVDADLYAVG